jgi:hypothetical protein
LGTETGKQLGKEVKENINRDKKTSIHQPITNLIQAQIDISMFK